MSPRRGLGPAWLGSTAASRAALLAAAAAAAGLVLVALVVLNTNRTPADPPIRTPHETRALRAFDPDSWWNTPLPDQAPQHPASGAILRHLREAPENGDGCLKLAGAGNNPWGTPIYWAEPGDRTYEVAETGHQLPPELASLRMPEDAEPAGNSDGSMVVYDLDKGYAVAMTDAVHHAGSDSWSASGATVTYLDSNGLHADTGFSDEPRNTGSHRGNNGPTSVISWDEATAGDIEHVLKMAAGPPVSNRYIFPMVGSDGDYRGSDPAVPPQGIRLRIRSSIDLEALGLSGQALTIAAALQRYGVYIGDSGGSTALKLEDTKTEGRGELWTVRGDDLCVVPFESQYWDVVAEDYGRSEAEAAQ